MFFLSLIFLISLFGRSFYSIPISDINEDKYSSFVSPSKKEVSNLIFHSKEGNKTFQDFREDRKDNIYLVEDKTFYSEFLNLYPLSEINLNFISFDSLKDLSVEDISFDVIMNMNSLDYSIPDIREVIKSTEGRFYINYTVPEFVVNERYREELNEYARLKYKNYLDKNGEYEKRVSYIRNQIPENLLLNYEKYYLTHYTTVMELISLNDLENVELTIVSNDIRINTIWNTYLSKIKGYLEMQETSFQYNFLNDIDNISELTIIRIVNKNNNIKPSFSYFSNISSLSVVKYKEDTFVSVYHILKERIKYINGIISDNSKNELFIYIESEYFSGLIISKIKETIKTTSSNIGIVSLANAKKYEKVFFDNLYNEVTLSYIDGYFSNTNTVDPLKNVLIQLSLKDLKSNNSLSNNEFYETYISKTLDFIIMNKLYLNSAESEIDMAFKAGEVEVFSDSINDTLNKHYLNESYIYYEDGQKKFIDNVEYIFLLKDILKIETNVNIETGF